MAIRISPFKSDIVEVLIGPDEERYHVHKDAICDASPFFRQCLQHDMQEGSTNTVTLPDDKPEAFECILKWVYGKTTEICTTKALPKEDLCTRAYLLADKLCMEALSNALMDDIMEFHKANFADANELLEVPESALKEFLIARLGPLWRGMGKEGKYTDPRPILPQWQTRSR